MSDWVVSQQWLQAGIVSIGLLRPFWLSELFDCMDTLFQCEKKFWFSSFWQLFLLHYLFHAEQGRCKALFKYWYPLVCAVMSEGPCFDFKILWTSFQDPLCPLQLVEPTLRLQSLHQRTSCVLMGGCVLLVYTHWYALLRTVDKNKLANHLWPQRSNENKNWHK